MSDDKVYEEVTTKHGSFYQEAVPLPYYGRSLLLRETFKCHCNAKFKTETDYEHHYRKEHISE